MDRLWEAEAAHHRRHATDTALEMNSDLGISVPEYTNENMSDKVIKILRFYTGAVNKAVWRKIARKMTKHTKRG